MNMKVISIIIVSVTVLFISRTLYNFITETIHYRRRMRRLKSWAYFNKQLINWSNEIVDPFIKIEFTNECLSKLTSSQRDEEIFNFDEESEKLKIIKKWGNHIPSLKQEWREMQLKKIL